MAQFSYITKSGAKANIVANDANEALKLSEQSRDAHSGVALRAEAQTPSTPPPGSVESPYQGTVKDRLAAQFSRLDSELSNVDSNPAYNSYQDPGSVASIRAADEARVQSVINAINQKYATVEAQDNETADLLQRDRRAANVLKGLSGSDTGAALTEETGNKISQIKNLTAKSKGAEIQVILSEADTRASDEFQKQKAAYVAQAKDKLQAEQGVRDKIQQKALAEISALAGTASWDDLIKKNPNLITQYKAETGLDDTALKALFLKETEANWDKIKEVDSPGKTTFVYKNKATGEVKTEDIDTPEGYKFYSGVGNDGAFINEATKDIKYINGPKGSSNKNSSDNSTPSSSVSWQDYLTAAEKVARISYDPTGEAYKQLKNQYDSQFGTPVYKGSEFTSIEKKKLEAAGLLNASRKDQLDYLYSKVDTGGA